MISSQLVIVSQVNQVSLRKQIQTGNACCEEVGKNLYRPAQKGNGYKMGIHVQYFMVRPQPAVQDLHIQPHKSPANQNTKRLSGDDYHSPIKLGSQTALIWLPILLKELRR